MGFNRKYQDSVVELMHNSNIASIGRDYLVITAEFSPNSDSVLVEYIHKDESKNRLP